MNDKTTNDRKTTINAVDSIIRSRKTQKVLAESQLPTQLSAPDIQKFDAEVTESISVSGWAPFHYDRKRNQCAEPWRYTLLFHQQCQKLAGQFDKLFTDVKPNNKIPKMLQACGALVLINWIPESDDANPKLAQINEEHLAATAAATQNLMLALEARGLGSYWSSGGLLGSGPLHARYGFEKDEKLLAAVFVHYPGLYPASACQILPGKNREKRATWNHWTRIIE